MEQDEDVCQGSYCLTVTYKCNWKCDYCCVDTHMQVEPTIEKVMSLAENIKPGTNVSFTGGEPGLMDENVLITLLEKFESMNCTIGLSTNGLFFIKFPQYLHRFKNIMYHCSQDLKNKVWKPPGHENLNIKYLIVVTDKNFPRLEKFLDKNADIEFAVYSADFYMVNRKPGQSLSMKNRITLYKEFKHRIRMDNLDYLFERVKYTKGCKDLIRLAPGFIKD